jgi:acetate kinase
VRALVVNAGSTSLKVSLLDRPAHESPATETFDSLDAALARADDVDVVIHRVVHGGTRAEPAQLDDAVVAELRALVELAPLHQPAALDLIDRCRTARPDVPQFACFDTSFHATVPRAGRTYALPERWRARVVVYGFHGISHAWSSRRVREVAPGVRRLVVAHLGGGASLCAVRDGRSVMTTMGFTPLDGLVMATRSGAVDPGAVLWMAEHADDGEDVRLVLERESGLLGLCGDADMHRVLERCDAGDTDALLAVEVYLHRLVTSIGACVAALGGVDGLVFTGGVGEHAAPVRELTAARLEWLGIAVDERPGTEPVREVTAENATVRTFVVEAREDLEMVEQVAPLFDVVSGPAATPRAAGPS